MSAPARRSLAAAASLISSAATCAEAFYCVLRGNTVTRETRDPFQPTAISLSLSPFQNGAIGEIQFQMMTGKETHCVDGGAPPAAVASVCLRADNVPCKLFNSQRAGPPMFNT